MLFEGFFESVESLSSFNSVTIGPGPTIVAVGGFTSEVGKTTLMCDLLRAFPGWEAIKTTRGHYRSCGKDPESCCVSHLLEDRPVIRSGRALTCAPGKDTGRFWDAGAANVHWVIATDGQVEEGIKGALRRVEASGVFIEGNSFTKFIHPDYFVMVVRPDDLKIKATANSVLSKVSALYISGETGGDDRRLLDAFLRKSNLGTLPVGLPVFTSNEFLDLVAHIAEIDLPIAADSSGRTWTQDCILSPPNA